MITLKKFNTAFQNAKSDKNIKKIKISYLKEKLECSSLEILSFIQDYNEHFLLGSLNSFKLHDGKKVQYNDQILDFFESLHDNPYHEKYVQWRIETLKNVLFFDAIMNGSEAIGFCIFRDFDKKDDILNKHLWRNTKSKLEKISHLFEFQALHFGGVGNSRFMKFLHISEENFKNLTEQGWELRLNKFIEYK